MGLKGSSGSWFFVLPVFAAFFVAPVLSQNPGLSEIVSWKSLDFDFPNSAARDAAINSKSFIPGLLVPLDVDVLHDDSRQLKIVFVTIPRFQDGVPATVGYVTDKKNSDGNPIIAPYPNWEMHNLENTCSNRITSVYRIYIDSCKRLWILDTGKLASRQVCPPQLLVFSLSDNRLLKRHVFPKDQYMDSSLFVTPVVDVRDPNGSCDDTFVYIADVGGFALIVYDHRNSRSWRIVNKLFYPYPQYGTFEIANDSFDLMDGIFGLALGPVKQDGDRILFFHSLASRTESWVSTSIIRNFTIFEHDAEASPRSFKELYYERSSQSAAEAMSKDGVLFFGLMSDLALGCWNSRFQYDQRNIEKVVIDREKLQFASGLKIINHYDREELWIMTVRFQKFIAGSMSPREPNFRIQMGMVDELILNTKCQDQAFSASNHNYAFHHHIPNHNHHHHHYGG